MAKGKAEPIGKNSGVNKGAADVAQANAKKGLVKVKFIKSLGSNDKGATIECHVSNANSLIAKGFCEKVK